MTGSPADEAAGQPDHGVDSPASNYDLEELRSIIVGPDRQRLSNLEKSLEDPAAQSHRVAQILPDAIALRGRDSALANAISPSVEKSIASIVRRNPRPLADALFPVMGPAIRRAIAHALASMVESLNRALEHSLSWKALRWRVEAWRTGRSFPEVVLVHTLLYRVEQVFLIHRESGLLLQHVTAPAVAAQDADMVSGMLTAIRDFVRDSFGVGEQESLEELQVGGLQVHVEQGPRAVLAAVVRGEVPPEFRSVLQEMIESIHLQWAEALESFAGDSEPFESTRPVLESCLEARYRDTAETKRSRSVRWIAVIAALLLVTWAGFWFRDRLRWTRYVERLASAPGLVVLSTGRESGKHVVTGLRDPLAADPLALLEGTGLRPDDLDGRWRLYQDLGPELTLLRARSILRPPETVRLYMEGGRLIAAGEAPEAWLDGSRRIASLIAGVTGFDDHQVVNADLRALVAAIEGTSLRFSTGTTDLVPGQAASIEALFSGVARLDQWADSRPATGVRLRVTGHTDSDGSPETNESLSIARAETVRADLLKRGLRRLAVVTAGAGSSRPLSLGGSEEDKQRNRRVSFKVELDATVR